MLLANRGKGGRRSRSFGPVGWVSLAAVAGLAVVACGLSLPLTGTSSGSNTIPKGLTTSSFTVDVASAMAQFKPLTQFATKGSNSLQVGVILPDTTSSTRYVNFDQPYLNAALPTPGTPRRSTASTTRREATQPS